MTILLLVYHVIGPFSSVHAILQTPTPQGAVFWTLILNTLPLVAVPAYWLFGRSKFNGYVETLRNTSQQVLNELNRIIRDIQP